MVFVFAALRAGVSYCQDWKAKLSADITKFGHRNWIVVADSAYPLQTSPESRPLSWTRINSLSLVR